MNSNEVADEIFKDIFKENLLPNKEKEGKSK